MHHRDALKLTPEAMLKHIPNADGKRFHIGLERGQLTIELYVPENEDLQKPHMRDECYIIIKGSGQFEMGEEIVSFRQGDFLFVPAGMKHRFINFGHSLQTWVIFYGPEGGDLPVEEQ